VHATAVRRFTLVDSVAATVSRQEAQRVAADPAAAQVIPDATFVTAAFDPNVQLQTGDLEQVAVRPAAGNTALGKAVELQPGKSATVNVTFKPEAVMAGAVLSGTLYPDTLQGGAPPYGQGTADEVAARPYSYTVG
jgi:hypothetical protein